MRSHIFNVDSNTFPVHRDREFCGTGKIGLSLNNYQQVLNQPRKFSDLITDLKGTRVGDLVFFYERQRGFHGVYQVISLPFFDPQEIFWVGEFSQHKVGADLPFRLLTSCIGYFSEPVPEDLIFSTPSYERIFWIPFYRKIQGPRGWLVSNLDSPLRTDLRRIFGPTSHIEWFANNVPFHVSQRHIDLLIYHKTPIDELIDPPLRYRFSVVELKKDQSKPEDVDQLMGYVKWVANRLADGEVDIVRPYIIAQDFHLETIERARSYKFNRAGIQLIKYEVTDENQISFNEV